MKNPRITTFFLTAVLLLMSTSSWSQKKKYNSLLWEITGNNMTQPSFLYGTMHISKKLAFNLGDSFYNAIRHADIVALELNPEYWQMEDQNLNNSIRKMRSFYSGYKTDYIHINTYKDNNPIDNLLHVIREEPADVNGFLYRSEYGEENFQEDTYLDLFIFQTGKKLGKKVIGLEHYLESQIMVMEGYKAEIDKQSENALKNTNRQPEDINQKMINAYRKGDLDELDSLYKLTIASEEFYEKMIVIRNKIQADGMDSLMKAGHRIFTGVGAAHLSGDKGVIEMLRIKGYTVRPIQQSERNIEEPKILQNIVVPVSFIHQYNADSTFSFLAPGKLIPINASETVDHIHFPDMANGAYFQISKIRTADLTQYKSSQRKLHVLDSLAYENFPGEIISKKNIQKGTYPGLEFYNKLKSGKSIKYQIYATPLEYIVFKVSGNGEYANSYIADSFFHSIQFHTSTAPTQYSPKTGGFEMLFPTKPHYYFTENSSDNLPEWRYSAQDPENDNIYAVIQKNIYTFEFIEPDSAAMIMMAFSMQSNDAVQKQIKCKELTLQGRKVQEYQYLLKDGRYLTIRCYIYGPQYFLTAVKSQNQNIDKDLYFQSFRLTPFFYPSMHTLKDTILNIQVKTPLQITTDTNIQKYFSLSKSMENSYGYQQNYDTASGVYSQSANFISYESGEVITLNKAKYGRYFRANDSAQWLKYLFSIDTALSQIAHNVEVLENGTQKYNFVFGNKKSNRIIKKSWLFNGNEAIYINSSYDKLTGESPFVSNFFSSINVLKKSESVKNIFADKLDLILLDVKSTDSNIAKSAIKALSRYNYDSSDLASMKKVLELSKTDTNINMNTKNVLISRIGSLKTDNEALKDEAANYLYESYRSAGDTIQLQSNILVALATLNNAKATRYFKELLLEDPLIFNNPSNTILLFTPFYNDSFKHMDVIFPDILTLGSTEDYKIPIYNLLAAKLKNQTLNHSIYESYLPNILFETNIAFKRAKQGNNNTDNYNYAEYLNRYPEHIIEYLEVANAVNRNEIPFLQTGAKLLAPYYNIHDPVKKLFHKLETSDNLVIQIIAADALMNQDLNINDSLMHKFTVDTSFQMKAYPYFKSFKSKKMAALFKIGIQQYISTLVHQFSKDYFKVKLLDVSRVNKKEEVFSFLLIDTASNEQFIAILQINQDSLGYFNINKEASNAFKLKKDEVANLPLLLNDLKTRRFISNYQSGKVFFSRSED